MGVVYVPGAVQEKLEPMVPGCGYRVCAFRALCSFFAYTTFVCVSVSNIVRVLLLFLFLIM